MASPSPGQPSHLISPVRPASSFHFHPSSHPRAPPPRLQPALNQYLKNCALITAVASRNAGSGLLCATCYVNRQLSLVAAGGPWNSDHPGCGLPVKEAGISTDGIESVLLYLLLIKLFSREKLVIPPRSHLSILSNYLPVFRRALLLRRESLVTSC